MENKLIAVVDGREIRESDLHALIHNLGQNAARFAGENGRAQLVGELVAQELFYSDAIANGLDQDPEYVTAVEEMQKSLLKQFALNKLLRDVTVSDEEASAYFEANKDLFKPQPSADASHILVATEEEANNILEEIKAGLSFADAAAKYSSCPSKERGGNLGQFSKGQMVPEFEAATFAMAPGEISAPVQTQFGYHLIELHSISGGDDVAFDAVKDQVKQQYTSVKHNEVYNNKQNELKATYTVEMK
ncbi:MAG: peptidylprolyl isomerase [Cellulosilyticaceae bacterium]